MLPEVYGSDSSRGAWIRGCRTRGVGGPCSRLAELTGKDTDRTSRWKSRQEGDGISHFGEIWGFGPRGSIDAMSWPYCGDLVKVRMIPTQPVGHGDVGYVFYLGRFGVLALGVP